MATANDFDDDFAMDIETDEDTGETNNTGHSSLEVRRRIEDMLEEKRLRKELDDFYDY